MKLKFQCPQMKVFVFIVVNILSKIYHVNHFFLILIQGYVVF